MTQNLLNIYDVTASLSDINQQKVAHVLVALDAPTIQLSATKALADIQEGRSRICAGVSLFALKASLTRSGYFNPPSELLGGPFRWINGVDSWSIRFTLARYTAPVGADDCQSLIQRLLPDLVEASFPNQGLLVVFNPDGRYIPRVNV